ncbi:MAG: hypothetical protein JJE13_07585 [Thermoleophilia bacterium]|nr:hypothetical protein [Thermoleophilia bacterium]
MTILGGLLLAVAPAIASADTQRFYSQWTSATSNKFGIANDRNGDVYVSSNGGTVSFTRFSARVASRLARPHSSG